MSAVAWAVALVAVQRLAELLWSARNARRLRAAGALEYGAGHYPLLVLLHAGWLAALLFLVPEDSAVYWPAAFLFIALQPVRLWIIASLGPRWTTRVLVSPGLPRIRRGPYRWVRHPNYALVAIEIAVLPLAFGVWEIALVCSLLNALLLFHRIRVEEAALASVSGHGKVYGVGADFRRESGS